MASFLRAPLVSIESCTERTKLDLPPTRSEVLAREISVSSLENDAV
jgi:hypothetical protein